MEFKEKIKALETFLIEQGEKKQLASPPLFKLFWKCGSEIPPPIFLPFGKIALSFGGYFSLFWGGFMYLLFWRKNEYNDITINIVSALLAGALWGIFMAAYFLHKRNKLKLSDWKTFPPTQKENDTEPAV